MATEIFDMRSGPDFELYDPEHGDEPIGAIEVDGSDLDNLTAGGQFRLDATNLESSGWLQSWFNTQGKKATIKIADRRRAVMYVLSGCVLGDHDGESATRAWAYIHVERVDHEDLSD